MHLYKGFGILFSKLASKEFSAHLARFFFSQLVYRAAYACSLGKYIQVASNGACQGGVLSPILFRMMT